MGMDFSALFTYILHTPCKLSSREVWSDTVGKGPAKAGWFQYGEEVAPNFTPKYIYTHYHCKDHTSQHNDSPNENQM